MAPARKLINSVDRDHEAWKSSLVDEVFGKEQDKVHMEKVVMLIWQFRDDQTVIQFMAQFVAKFANRRDVFDGIEFYLPQLAHMIIHLEVNWDDSILERFALIIAQQSLHFALQLNWILQAAIEDYEPELPDGNPNPRYQPLFYSRCVKLLTNIEKCVVYGRSRSLELQRLYEKGKITKQEYDILDHADRRFNALQITSNTQQDDENQKFGGLLLYKRKARSACYKPKPWKERYFSVDDRMLHCYNAEGGTLVRSMPLEGAIVEESSGKYPNMFFVENRGFHFVMRAKDEADKQRWMEVLQEEAKALDLFNEASANPMVESLTPSQKSRFDFFKNERDFIRDVCGVAETLRFQERSERKKLAPGLVESMTIPPVVYSPLVNSTEIWRRVERTIPKDTKVFNTNERCPLILHFISKRGELLSGANPGSAVKDPNLDVAEYLRVRFDILGEANTGESGMEIIQEDEITEAATPKEAATDVDGQGQEVVIGPSEENGEAISNSDHGSLKSSVWMEPADTDASTAGTASRNPHAKGNRHVQAFLRDNLVSIPRKLGDRIGSKRNIGGKRKSALDMATKPFETVPILEGSSRAPLDDDERSTVSIERGSVLANSAILLGDHEEGEIDMQSIERAKAVVCGGESWADKTKRMLEENVTERDQDEGVTEITSVMAKSNDDLRQEVFVMQMIHFYKSVFAKADLPMWLKTYQIRSVSQQTGLIEVLTDATSIDGLKKSEGYPKEGGLRAYFEQTYGEPDTISFKAGQTNFMQSLAAYSVVSYLLGLKDRHNGNIMIDTRGHMIHIDFGFAMGMAPGNEFSFERAPFKLTQEYVDVLGGVDSECFSEFRRLFVAGMEEARKNSLIALGLVEIMMYKSNYPCFTGRGAGVKPLKAFEERLMLHVPDDKVKDRALALIDQSMNHRGTHLYDAFQQWSNGYAI